jgi:CspA family cold shock protein
MANGTVKWFNAGKGYGFIHPEDGGPDVFVHVTALQQAGIAKLDDGQSVSYELSEEHKGRRSAVNLRV